MDDLTSSERFNLGALVMTQGVKEKVPSREAWEALVRHVHGDWGDLCEEDRISNNLAVLNGAKLLSVYQSKSGIRFWIVTEWDRSVTTVLLPAEY